VAGDVELTYNGLGQRVEKVAPTETTRYVYDEERLLQETDGADDPQREYTFAAEEYGQLVSEFDDNASASSYYQYDAQWSTNALIDPDQAPTDRYRYRAFGLETLHEGDSPNPLTFVGKQGYYRDAETELYFLGMAGNSTRAGGRFYDPVAGRFLTPDPIKLDAGDLNIYRYVKNNPINVIDPSGLMPPKQDPCKYDKTIGAIRITRAGQGAEAKAWWEAKWKEYSWNIIDGSYVSARGTDYYPLGQVEWLKPGQDTESRILRTLPTSGGDKRTIQTWQEVNAAAKAETWGSGQPGEEDYEDEINKWWGKQTGVDVIKKHTSIWEAVTGFFGDLLDWAITKAKDAACSGLNTFIGKDVCSIFSRLGTNCGGFLTAFGNAVWKVAGAFFTSGTEIVYKLIEGIKGGFGKLDFNSIINILGQWLGFDEGDLQEIFGKVIDFFKTGNLGDALEALLKFFGISVDSLAQVISEVLPGADKIILPLFGALETLITEGPQAAGEFVKEVFGEAVSDVTSFVTDFPKVIMDNLGKALKEFLPNMLKDLGQKFFTGGIRPFFDLLDGIADGCGRATKFVTKLGDAVAAAADGGSGNIAGAIFEGIKSTIRSVLDIVGKLLGIDRLKDTIKKARDSVKTKVKDLLKKILNKLKGVLHKVMKKKSEEEKEGTGIGSLSQIESGQEYKIYISQDGEAYLSLNPSCKAAALAEVPQLTTLAKSLVSKSNGKSKKAQEITKVIKALKDTIIKINAGNWNCPDKRRTPDLEASLGPSPYDIDPNKFPKHQAHHILPVTEIEKNKGLGFRLCCLGIDLNSVINGVWLPICKKGKSKTAQHMGRNLPEYITYVTGELQDIKTASAAIRILGRIKKELLDGDLIINGRDEPC
jgi:RHS repeat-associated protein